MHKAVLWSGMHAGNKLILSLARSAEFCSPGQATKDKGEKAKDKKLPGFVAVKKAKATPTCTESPAAAVPSNESEPAAGNETTTGLGLGYSSSSEEEEEEAEAAG